MLDRKAPAVFEDLSRESFTGRSVAFMSGSALPAVGHPLTARARAAQAPEAPVALTDPALAVVTDFTWEPPVTVTEDHVIDDALKEMRYAGVGALLVLREEMVTGLITVHDMQGERQSQFRRMSAFPSRDAIEVRHLMTPWDRVPTLEWRAVRAARLHILVELLRATRASHVVIVEQAEHNGVFVRGLISRTRLERQLRGPID
jgi:CBS domain-containing protein